MSKIIVFLLVLLNNVQSFKGDESIKNEDKTIAPFKSLNNKDKGAFYYEINSKTFCFNTLVTLKGYFDPVDSKKDWFVVFNASTFYLPIYYYIDGNFYFIDLKAKKIFCVQNCFYKVIITNENSIGGLFVFPNEKLNDDRLIIDLTHLDEKKLIEFGKKKDSELSIVTLKNDARLNITIKDNYIQALEILKIGTDFPVLSYKEITNKSEIDKANLVKDLLLKYIENLKELKLIEVMSKENYDIKEYFDSFRVLGSFISFYGNIITTKKIPDMISLYKKELYKINQETHLEYFNNIYFDFLKFHKENKSYLKWHDLLYVNCIPPI